MMTFGVGDIVLLRGQHTLFFEVIKVEGDILHVSDGKVQISRTPEEVTLICKAENRQDPRVPVMKYWSNKSNAVQ